MAEMTLGARDGEPFWMRILRDMARNPLYMHEQALPIVNDATWGALASYIDALTAENVALRAERDALKARQMSWYHDMLRIIPVEWNGDRARGWGGLSGPSPGSALREIRCAWGWPP